MTLQKAHHLIVNIYQHKQMWERRNNTFSNQALNVYVHAIEKKGQFLFEAVHKGESERASDAFTTHFIMPEKYDELLLVLRTLELI